MVCLFCNKTINGNNKTQRCKVSVKYSEENSLFGEVSYSTFSIFGGWEGKGGGRLFEFQWEWKGSGMGMGAYSRLGANSGLGAYSNKYGILVGTGDFYVYIHSL